MQIKELTDLKDQIKESDDKRIRTEGKLEGSLKILEDEYGLKDLEETELEIDRIETELQEMSQEIETEDNALQDLLDDLEGEEE